MWIRRGLFKSGLMTVTEQLRLGWANARDTVLKAVKTQLGESKEDN